MNRKKRQKRNIKYQARNSSMGCTYKIDLAVLCLCLLLLSGTNQKFCSLFPALAKSRKFDRDRVEKSDGTFDFARNGFEHTILGWFRVSDKFLSPKSLDSKKKVQEYSLFRYKAFPNPYESVDPVFDNLIKLIYTHRKSGDSSITLWIANGKDKVKKVVRIPILFLSLTIFFVTKLILSIFTNYYLIFFDLK